MKLVKFAGAMALGVSMLAASTVSAMAAELSMWVRASGANAAQHLVDLWNETHDDRINLTVIPDDQMVTKLATGVAAGDVPDVISFDLIYMPDFMRAGFLEDLTDFLDADPNQAKVAEAYKELASYEGRLYGTGFTPDVSVLVWNKDLFEQAGLDPEKGPTTVGEIHEMAKKIRALGDDTYGFFFSGACPGCKSKGSLPPSIVLEVLQILEGEVNLREETRVAEQSRPSRPARACRRARP
jgi:multiple sugar transport system substrate-binding protein